MESDEIDSDKIDFYKSKKGLFATIEFKTSGVPPVTKAIGVLKEIDDQGYITIQHLKIPQSTWRFLYTRIISESFEPIKHIGGRDAQWKTQKKHPLVQ